VADWKRHQLEYKHLARLSPWRKRQRAVQGCPAAFGEGTTPALCSCSKPGAQRT